MYPARGYTDVEFTISKTMVTKAESIDTVSFKNVLPAKASWQGIKFIPTALILSLALVLWLIAPPTGLTTQTWHLFIIFITTIFAIIAKPLPMGAIVVIALSFCAGTKTLTMEQCLSTFSSSIVWLIVMAFFLARGFSKTGLGTRLAYFFLSILGRSSLGIAYGLVLTELILAPFIPSNTARGAGIIYPIATALATEQGSHANSPSARILGAFLIKVCFQINMITSAMFMTGLVGNPLIANLASNANVTIDWGTWALAAIVPGLCNLIILPWALYKLYPPTLKNAPQTIQIAKQKLKDLGKLKPDEGLMVCTFLLVLALWILGDRLGIDATTTAFIGLSILLVGGIINWQDVIKESGAWDTMIWFAPLLMMASFLTKFGMMTWFTQNIQGHIGHLSWPLAFLILSLIYFYVHYLFASVTTHITALYSAFLLVLVGVGTPPILAAMSLAVLSSLSGSLTHFGTPTAPIYFGAGYIPLADWWRLSFILSLINISIWALVGGLWWKCLGYW